ncbi:MAG: DUF302 domain-containing protein [Acidiferrobacter sp.]
MDIVTTPIALSLEVVVERLTAAIAAAPLGLVSHINGQANAARRGLTVEGDQILEVFRPDLAVRVWTAEKAAGLDIPIRLHVYVRAGQTYVGYRRPSVIFAHYQNAALDALGAELDGLFAGIVAAIDP